MSKKFFLNKYFTKVLFLPTYSAELNTAAILSKDHVVLHICKIKQVC